jgi:NADH dehydrogenase FAD-containing subunit
MSLCVNPLENILLPLEANPIHSLSLSEKIAEFACQTDGFAAPFQFLNLGILAYTGDQSTLAQLQLTPVEKSRLVMTGTIGIVLWRSIYLAKQVSWRNRVGIF